MSFIKGILTDKDGVPSSKRVILFMFVITFLVVVFINLLAGKQLSSVLGDQLFYLVIYALSAVFGENITAIFKKGAAEKQGNEQ